MTDHPAERRPARGVTMPDHLAGWLAMRQRVAWSDVVAPLAGPMPALRDGFAAHALGKAGRGRERLDRLRSAQAGVRAAAAAHTPLTPDLVAGWSRLVLGVPAVEFRSGPAYAKGGRERYGRHADTEQRFAACLAEADEPGVPVAARAARVYLDVAFFHPFADGNARLAGLTLQFVLARERIELDDVTAILDVVRCADDAEGAASLARLIHGTALASHRRRIRFDARTTIAAAATM